MIEELKIVIIFSYLQKDIFQERQPLMVLPELEPLYAK